MKSVSELIVHVADLAEAEGKVLRRETVRVVSATLVMLVGAALVVFALTAIFLGVHHLIDVGLGWGPGWAWVIVGLMALGLGGWIARKGKKDVS